VVVVVARHVADLCLGRVERVVPDVGLPLPAAPMKRRDGVQADESNGRRMPRTRAPNTLVPGAAVVVRPGPAAQILSAGGHGTIARSTPQGVIVAVDGREHLVHRTRVRLDDQPPPPEPDCPWALTSGRALAAHRRMPPGRRHLGCTEPDRDEATDDRMIPLPEPGTLIVVRGGPRDGQRGWIRGRQGPTAARVRWVGGGERSTISARHIVVDPEGEPEPLRATVIPKPRPNQHRLPLGARAEVIGGRYRGRMASIERMSGAAQVLLRLDDGRRVAPSVHFVRVLG